MTDKDRLAAAIDALRAIEANGCKTVRDCKEVASVALVKLVENVA